MTVPFGFVFRRFDRLSLVRCSLSQPQHLLALVGRGVSLDHIIPQADAQKTVLRGHNLPEHRIQEILVAVHSLCNLQLLRGDENNEKGSMPFRSWITGRRMDYHDQHMIPDRLDLCDVMWLPEFVREREKLIRQRLMDLVGPIAA